MSKTKLTGITGNLAKAVTKQAKRIKKLEEMTKEDYQPVSVQKRLNDWAMLCIEIGQRNYNQANRITKLEEAIHEFVNIWEIEGSKYHVDEIVSDYISKFRNLLEEKWKNDTE